MYLTESRYLLTASFFYENHAVYFYSVAHSMLLWTTPSMISIVNDLFSEKYLFLSFKQSSWPAVITASILFYSM